MAGRGRPRRLGKQQAQTPPQPNIPKLTPQQKAAQTRAKKAAAAQAELDKANAVTAAPRLSKTIANEQKVWLGSKSSTRKRALSTAETEITAAPKKVKPAPKRTSRPRQTMGKISDDELEDTTPASSTMPSSQIEDDRLSHRDLENEDSGDGSVSESQASDQIEDLSEAVSEGDDDIQKHTSNDTLVSALVKERTMLIQVATQLERPTIATRLNMDDAYTTTIIGHAANRVSHLRSALYKNAIKETPLEYGLEESCEPSVIAILQNDFEYIYGVKPDGTTALNRPFHRDIFPILLAKAYFVGGTTSIAHQHQSLLTPSDPSKTHQKKISAVMLGTVCIMIFASLSCWSSGHFKETKFIADTWFEHYGKVMAYLEYIKVHNAKGYHKMMHRLYNETLEAAADGTTLTSEAAGSTSLSACQRLDIDRMEISDDEDDA